MEEMDNNKEVKVRKPTAAQIAKKEEQARQKIAFNLDNYMIATDICIAILQVEDTSGEVKDRANDVLLNTLDKINNL
jgi:hypothetical protein